MERFKWFDYLGALLLLCFVTKSALTPQVSADSSGTKNPPASRNQVVDSFQYASEQTSNFQIERANSSGRPLLEEGSISSSFKGDLGSETSAVLEQEKLSSSVDPMLCAYIWRESEGSESHVRFELFSDALFCDGSSLYLVDKVRLMGQ